MENIGFIGLGIMGKPMVNNLVKAGNKIYVYDIDPEQIRISCECKDVLSATSIKDIAKKCNIIITMLPNSPQSEEVILGELGIINFTNKETVVIDMSSIDPIVSIKIGRKLAERGIEFLDAPVSGGEPKAIDGTLSIMVGGKKELFEKVVHIFKSLGQTYTWVGEIGSGNFAKLSNQIIVALNIAAVSEALLLAKAAGLSPTIVFEAIRKGLAGSAVLENKTPKMIARDFKPGFKINLHQKDLQNVMNAGEKLNVPLPLTSALLEILKSLTSAGKGEEDHCAIVKYFENLAGLEINF
jgi:2-hydroxy-3-oxopropionate reductase